MVPVVSAFLECWNMRVDFDAVRFLADADAEEIEELVQSGWSGYPACHAAEACRGVNGELRMVFEMIGGSLRGRGSKPAKMLAGINAIQARTWLSQHRPALYEGLVDGKHTDWKRLEHGGGAAHNGAGGASGWLAATAASPVH